MDRIPKMVTIREAAKTGILPANALRVLVRNGNIPAVYSGKKAFINYDNLCAYLQNLSIERGNENERRIP